MFEFTTQTVLNAVSAATAAKATSANNVVVDETEGKEYIFVKDAAVRLPKANIESIYYRPYEDAVLPKVVVNPADANEEGIYRIALYIGLNHTDIDSFYANSLTYKGKPLYIEFAVEKGEQAAAIAAKIKKNAEKYLLFTTDVPMLTVTVGQDNKVTFEGVKGSQIFRKAELQKFDPAAITVDCCTNEGEFIKVKDLEITPGHEAFGDYEWMIHNLRIPTFANTDFWAANKADQPAIGGKYHQFTFRLKKDRDGIAGEVVGERATSVTTHVFYVIDSAASAFKTEAAKVGDIVEPYTNAEAATNATTNLDPTAAPKDKKISPKEAKAEEQQGGGN